MSENTKIYKEVPEMISFLKGKGVKLGIVSGKLRYRIEEILEIAGLRGAFDLIIGGEDVVNQKPDSEGLKKCLEYFRFNPNEVFYVGDSVTDAQTVRKTDIDFFVTGTGVTEKEEFEGYMVRRFFSDLSEIVELFPEIRSIHGDDTLEIRRRVMWPDRGIEYVRVPEDAEGEHFGVYLGEKLVSVISLFFKGNEMQFRKFATLEEFQGLGFGKLLLEMSFFVAQERGAKRIWCNARKNKVDFYQKAGMLLKEECFSKDGVEYVIMERHLDSK